MQMIAHVRHSNPANINSVLQFTLKQHSGGDGDGDGGGSDVGDGGGRW